MREVVFDLETTGIGTPLHRIVEIGCVELEHRIPTGNALHFWFNPDRFIPGEVFAIHGLSDYFLADKAHFADHAGEILGFLGGAVVAHNAEFDVRHLNAELARAGWPPLAAKVTDTLVLARRKWPGQPNNLDACCARLKISTVERGLHGAMLDAGLCAEVYLALTGGRQAAMNVEQGARETVAVTRAPRAARPHEPSPEEALAHEKFLDEKIKGPIWRA